MSTYSLNTFVFNLQAKRKLNGNGTSILCNSRYGPCFGASEFYFSCCSFTLYTSRTMRSFGNFGSYNRGQQVNIEVYYRVY